MKIVYRLVGTKEIKKVYVRLYHDKLSLPVPTGLIAELKDWDENSELYKEEDELNKILLQLKINIKKAFNTDYSSGIVTDAQWLKNIIKTTFKRPTGEEKMLNHENTIFLYNFGFNWVKNDPKANVLTNKAKSQKLNALEQFNSFQTKKETRIKLVDFDTEKIEDFYSFLVADKEYAPASAKKIIGEIKFLCQKAERQKINVNPDYKSLIYLKSDIKRKKAESVYLNDEEIKLIFNYDFSHSEILDIMRDNFILNLWTGIRISDLKKLNPDSFVGKNIESTSIKTNTLSAIPIHPQVQYILDKRFGNLPPKVNKNEYNIQIKEICRLCEIDTPTEGWLFSPEKKRTIFGIYPKYKLVSSHTSRRSFATNLSNIMTVSEITKLGGWNTEDMANHYNKKQKLEIAKKLSDIWQSN